MVRSSSIFITKSRFEVSKNFNPDNVLYTRFSYDSEIYKITLKLEHAERPIKLWKRSATDL